MTIRVLVCGGRMFGERYNDTPPEAIPSETKRVTMERRLLDDTLNEIYRAHAPIVIIHGSARGADSAAAYWAKRKMIPEEPYKADWKSHGKAAGPIRNQKMIDEGAPDLVVAFPGGRGTADMIRRAKSAGIRVIEV